MNRIQQLITANFDRYDGKDIEAYIRLGGFTAIKKAVEQGSDYVIDELKLAGIKGRGGAAYPTWKKWDAGRRRVAEQKFVICNADEGEPGTFKDREILKKDPYKVIEGMMISAYIFGAKKGFVYIREEYWDIQKTFKKAIEKANEAGYLGEGILGTDFDFTLEVFSGAGAYVCGEGSSLIESMEGHAGRPRIKSPRIGEKGYLGYPTLVNNVETLAGVTRILEMGASEYARYGTEKSKGTKVISVSGNVNRPGVYEVPFGVSLREIVYDVAGGVENDRPVKFLQLGGISGPLVPGSALDTKYAYETLDEKGFTVGSGSVVVVDDNNRIIDYLVSVSDFFYHESCGKCTPCREGKRQLTRLLKKFVDGTARLEDVNAIEKVANTMKHASFCGLGQTAPTAILSALKYFMPELWQLVEEGVHENVAEGEWK
ncbi:MAG: SLBB domain-containing protein [Clostridia bacterium]|nr:SLBB domain-containing protein [Clostridia bacterium]